MNDPREFKQLDLPVMSGASNPLPKDQLDLTQQLVNDRRLAMRVGAFTCDQAGGSGSSLVRADSRGFARPMMWTHYADMHAGVCLVLERGGLEDALRLKFGSDLLVDVVSYSSLTSRSAWSPMLEAAEVRAHGAAAAAERFFELYKHDLLFIKNQDWAVEREWRVVIGNQPAGIVDLPLGSGVVAGLVVGMNMPEGDLNLVKNIATTFGISDHVARAYLHQLNVIDVLPVDSSSPIWRYYTAAELAGLGRP